ncbi:transmembrane and coiled-coil domains protein 2-like isoform X4 [Apostichopus japonicus]|uniref:transmembrane and coiled-coil domains protein 2-like isoform X4 n=1 Tax=Stichopus japonicus TaxID=307972 RepID=UPI003AB55F3D
MATVNETGKEEGENRDGGNEGSGDPSGRRLSRSAENILSGSSRKGTSGRPASPQVSSKLSQGFKGLFNRKRDNESISAESSPAATLDRPPVSYAEDILNLPVRPTAFNRVLQQIRSRPNMKKTPEGRLSTGKLQAARTKSDGSDTETFREESRHKRGTISSRDGDNRSGHDDSDVGDSGPLYYGSDMDETDGTVENDTQKTKLLMDHYMKKIEKTKELMKAEQKVKDDNVAEYLNIAGHADKQQIARIKNVFEKKNQKSNQTIAHLQKKLETNQKQVQDLMYHGVQGHKRPKEVLQGVQQGLRGVKENIKEGISGFSGLIKHATPSPVPSLKRTSNSDRKIGVADKIGEGLSGLQEFTHTAARKISKTRFNPPENNAVVSKPKEIAKSFKNKFGSADNIDTMGVDGDPEAAKSKSNWFAPPPDRSIPTSGGSEEESASATSGSLANGMMSHSREDLNNQPFEHPLASTVNHLQEQVRTMMENQVRLEKSVEDLQTQLQQQYQYLVHLLQEERYKSGRLQEQLTDLTDLHQHAINNVQQEVAAVEERLDYRGEERLRDLQEHLENNVARVSKLEAGQQDQQVLALEDYSNASPRVLLTKLANVVIAILAVILVFVSTISNTLGPFLSTRGRSVGTIICGVALFYLWKRREIVDHLFFKLGEQYQFLFDHRT